MMLETRPSVLPQGMSPDLAEALSTLFEEYSDARTDYGPPPTRSDIASSQSAAIRAFEMVRDYLVSQPASTN